jgi:hypothetical protein
MIMMSWACESDARRFGQRVTTHYAEEGEDIATAIADRTAGGNRALTVARGALVVLSVAVPLAFIVATVANGKGPLGVNVPEAVGAVITLALVIGVSRRRVRVTAGELALTRFAAPSGTESGTGRTANVRSFALAHGGCEKPRHKRAPSGRVSSQVRLQMSVFSKM